MTPENFEEYPHAAFDRFVRRLSDHIDAHQKVDRGPYLVRIRTGKIQEELGEVELALIGVEGSNPRKGHYGHEDDVAHELMDTAIASLGAWYHVTQDPDIFDAMLAHVAKQNVRAGL